jgi:5'-methylthioadenosine phosphorylase
LDITLHTGLTYACVEGPRLGTRAESHFMRGAGCHLVGMTNVPEVFLAREAQICYATVGIVTGLRLLDGRPPRST